MIKQLLIGVGIFALGYAIGKAVGRTEAELSGRLEWEGDADSRFGPEQSGGDAEFVERDPEEGASTPRPA